MFVLKKWQKFLAKTLIALLLLTNPSVPAAVHAEADTQAEDKAADEDGQQKTVTLTLDKGANTETAANSAVSDTANLTDKEKARKFTNSLLAYFLSNGKASGPQWLKTTDFSFRLNDNNKPVYSFETVQPVGGVNKDGALWFWQGRYAYTGDAARTANLGFGWRKLSDDKKSLVGVNAFYDYGFQYNLERVGLGLEYFNRLAEYRFNYYLPVSGDRLTGTSYLDSGILYSYIRAVEGFDFELGAALPSAPWWKLYAGGYYWDNKHNSDERGVRLRSTMQLTPRVSVEVSYLRSNTTGGEMAGKVMYNMADALGPSFWGDLAGKVDGKDIAAVSLQVYEDGKPVGEPIILDKAKLKARYTVEATYLDKNGQPIKPKHPKTNDLTYKLLAKVERQNDIKTETFKKFVAYTGNVIITVYQSDGTTPISGSSVALTVGSAVYSATTDSSGSATFSGIATGTYSFTASATGYTSGSGSVTVTSSGGSSSVNISAQTFTITATVAGGTGGTITDNVDANSITTTGSSNVAYGGTITYTFTPSSGYSIKSVIVDGTDVGPQTQYILANVTAGHTIILATQSTTNTYTHYTVGLIDFYTQDYSAYYSFNGVTQSRTEHIDITLTIDAGTTIYIHTWSSNQNWTWTPGANGQTYTIY